LSGTVRDRKKGLLEPRAQGEKKRNCKHKKKNQPGEDDRKALARQTNQKVRITKPESTISSDWAHTREKKGEKTD